MRRPLRYYLPDYRYLLGIAGTIILFDQITKALVRSNLTFTDAWGPESLLPYMRIVHWKNTGAAFGLFQNGNLVFIILGILVSIAILNFYPLVPRQDRWLRAALAFQLGGAVGNLIDRLHQGYVTDFVSILRFPVFNVADASISLGVALIILPLLPNLFDEMEGDRLLRFSREINRRRRVSEQAPASTEEPVSLGLMELLLGENESMQRFLLKQDVRRIRQRVFAQRKGTSRG